MTAEHCLKNVVVPLLSGAVGVGTRQHLAEMSLDDWEQTIEKCRSLGVAPLVYHEIRNNKLDTFLPTRATELLRSAFVHGAAHGIRLSRALASILSALATRGIPCIVLKGAYLAHKVYENRVLRPMSDIDLLVSQRDLASAATVLQDLGYYPREQYTIQKTCQLLQHLPVFFNGSGDCVELHWHIQPPGHSDLLDLRGLWTRAQPFLLCDSEALALSHEDLLVHLSLHLAYHEFSACVLRTLCDICEICKSQSPAVNWAQLIQIANDSGTASRVSLVLTLARDVLKAEIPDSALAGLKTDPTTEAAVSHAKTTLFRSHADTEDLGDAVAVLLSNRSLLAKARLAFSRLFPPSAELAREYRLHGGPLQKGVFYLVHIWHLVKRNLAGVLGCLFLGKAVRKRKLTDQERLADLRQWIREQRRD